MGVPFFSYFSGALPVIATGKAEILLAHLVHLLSSGESVKRRPPCPPLGAPHIISTVMALKPSSLSSLVCGEQL